MTEKKLTTYDLVDKYFHLCQNKEYMEKYNLKNPDDPIDNSQLEEVNTQLTTIENGMVKKIDNIEHVIIRKDEAISVIDARIQTYTDHLKRLKTKKNSINNGWKRLQSLIGTIVKAAGNQSTNGNRYIKTDTMTYTVFNTPGKLEITNEDKVPKTFQEVQIKVDKARLRKHVINEGGQTDYAIVPQEERLRTR